MECVRQSARSTHRSRRVVDNDRAVPEPEMVNVRSLEDSENNKGNTSEGDRDTGREIAEFDRRGLNSVKTLLTEQEEAFKTEQESVETRKQMSKERVTDLFERFRKLLAEKETELLHKIDSEFALSQNFLADFVSNIEREKQEVDHLLENAKRSENEIRVEDVQDDINRKIDMRNDILNQYSVPYLVLYEESINTVKNLSFGGFHENATSESQDIELESNNAENETGNTQNLDFAGYDDTVTKRNDSCENNEEDDRENNLAESVVDENQSFDEEETPPLSACGTTRAEECIPSAPPLEPGESPPPYWQAMGYEQPKTDEISEAALEVPGYYDIPHSPVNQLPDNKLQLWHSFPVRRQHDRRAPLAVSLAWNQNRICLADKANMKIKFFSPNGQLLTEMCFGGTDIYDVAFLEECQGESRYAVTSPKSGVVVIISIDPQNIPKIIRKLTFKQHYSCISRGPMAQTLLGAEVAQNSAVPVLHMFTFTGQILLSIGRSPSFNFLKYIKSVKVFGRNIIILDWKLNFVAIFDGNGKSLGEYHGTPNYPLINPLDMTLDNKGNILILNGEFSNIHVIDQSCNFVEIIKIPRNVSSTSSSSKLISFDTGSQRLAIARGNGDIAIFTFENGYDCLPQRNLPPNFGATATQAFGNRAQRAPEVLPLVEGMLPSTIEDIIMRQPARNRSRQFHL